MNELIAETIELEKYIQGKVAEGEGSRAEELASIYFGCSASLEREVLAGRVKPEEACRRRYNAARAAAGCVSNNVRAYQTSRAKLDRLFAQFRQKVAGIRDANNN
jgi:hypothetical protein